MYQPLARHEPGLQDLLAYDLRGVKNERGAPQAVEEAACHDLPRKAAGATWRDGPESVQIMAVHAYPPSWEQVCEVSVAVISDVKTLSAAALSGQAQRILEEPPQSAIPCARETIDAGAAPQSWPDQPALDARHASSGLHQHLRGEIHARPAFFQKVGDHVQAQPAFWPSNDLSADRVASHAAVGLFPCGMAEIHVSNRRS
jgi:hypothetical protein